MGRNDPCNLKRFDLRKSRLKCDKDRIINLATLKTLDDVWSAKFS